MRKSALHNYPQTGEVNATAFLWKAVENLVDSHAAEMVQPRLGRVRSGAVPAGTRSAATRCPRYSRAGLSNAAPSGLESKGAWLCLHRYDGLLVLLVGALEVGDLVVGFEVPDAGGDFVD